MPGENLIDPQTNSPIEELRIINNLLNRICQLQETNHIMSAIIAEIKRLIR